MASELTPAVITFRPDNLLTVGLLGAGAYVAAVFAVQLLMRAGVIKPMQQPQPGNAPAPGTSLSAG